MSPEVSFTNRNHASGKRPLLGCAAALAVLILCALLLTGSAWAWTPLPEDGVAALSEEQQTLIESLPEGDRPLAYCLLTGTDVLTFFRQYSDYADLIAREGLTSSMATARYMTGTRHPDFSTPEGQAEKQFLLELNIALGGWFCSYRDPAAASVSIYYSETLQNKSLEQLTRLRSGLDTGRVFNTEELPMWKRILDAWIVYRGGSVESQTTGSARQLLDAYNTGAYPALNTEEQRLLAEMPEVYRLLTYAALSGTDGLSWLRENSPAGFEQIGAYWDMDRQALSDAYGALAAAGGAGGTEAMLVQQLFMLRAKTYVWLQAGTWGIESRDSIRMQDLARGGDKLLESVETIERFLDENSASIGWSAEGDMALACRAWLDYFERIMPEAAAQERARRREEAARSALLSQTGDIREWSDAYRAEKGMYAIPAVSAVPEDAALDSAQQQFLRAVPMRFLPHAYHYLRADLSTEQVMAACTAENYRGAADGLLLYSVPELEAEYVSLLGKATVEDLNETEAVRLELCAEILLCRYQEAGKISFGTLLVEYEKKNSQWKVAYYAELEDPLLNRSADSLEEQAEREAERADPNLHSDVLDAGITAALAEYKRNMRVTPEMDERGRRIYAATMPDMRAYAAAIVTGVIDPCSGLEYAEMPEQLWTRRENRNYGGMSYDALNKLLSYYGAPPYHESSHVSWYTASDSNLREIVGSVNQYTADAVAEAQRILWHRNAEFYSTKGTYHAQLARMSVDALYRYRAELEAKYYTITDAADITELRNWIEQINAWMDWAQERQTQKAEKERQEAEVWGREVAPDLGVPAEDRTYILELSTGMVSGENIEFFRIVYETEDGDTRTQYLFPTEDSLRSGYRAAAEAGTPQRVLDWVKSVVGYDTADPYLSESLQSFHTDQFLFISDGAIRSVTEIQAFMRRDAAEGKNEWTCTGLRLYKVDGLQGLARYGYCSSDCYIDFRGTVVAELAFADENLQNISWRNSDTLFRFGGAAGTEGYSLIRSGETREVQSNRYNVIFRIDFADQYLAGLECLATDYQGSNTKSLTRPGGLCEALALQVRYRDTHGSVREVTLPVISSAAAWSALDGGVSGIEDYAGLAQQGERLGFAGTLPELAEVLYVSPVLGGDAAAAAARLTPDPAMPAAAARNIRIAASNSESASIVSISVYDATRTMLNAGYEDGFLRFDFPSIPEQFYRAADITGLRVDAGGAVSQLRMEPFTENSQLLPRETQERYLVTLVTDDVEMAGTSSDVVLRLGYVDVDGNEKQTPEFLLRDYAGDYYGYWPASAGDFGYLYGLSSGPGGGQSLSVLLPVQDVQRFTSVTVRLVSRDGESIDEWQMKDLSIQTVGSVGARSVAWENVGVGGDYSDRVFSRNITGSVIYRLSQGGAVDPGLPVFPTEPAFEPELFQQGEPTVIDIETPSVAEREDVDWSYLRYTMTFADTQQDLGFLKPRASYSVQVKVSSNVSNVAEEDDCGSRNQFYFQLLFAQGGKSAIVLANQQLQSDGFHAGSTEVFTITTSQEYGDLSGIRIIPEDMASDSDKYDKLKIDSITVIRQGDGQMSPLWRIRDVGWIGIDYRDEGEKSSVSGVSTRTMEELSRVYNVTESSYAVNVQFAISTGQYKDRRGVSAEQFQGEMSAEITYRDVNGVIQRQNIEDVVALMYAYNNRAVQYTSTQDSELFMGGKAGSDPDYMFRANHTDRFILSLDGLEQLLNIKLYPRSSVNTVWNISDVNASLIVGEGRRILNVAGEFIMKYPEGQEPKLIARSDSTGDPKYTKTLYASRSEAGVSSPITVNFTSEKLQTGTELFDSQTVVTEVPVGGGDSFNFVIYPTSLSRTGSILDYDLTVNIRYTTATDQIVQNTSVMNRGQVNGQPVFYLEGLSAPNLVQLNSVSVRSSSSFGNGISGGYVQRVRGGFVLESYELGEAANIEHAVEVPFTPSRTAKQTLCLQLGPEMQEIRLKPGGNDVAVAIHYRTEGPVGREYQSRRLFLASEGYGSLGPGQIVELEFNEGYLEEITGVSLIPMGQVQLDLGGAYAVCTQTEPGGTVTQVGRFSFADAPFEPATGVIRRNRSSAAEREAGSVLPLYMRFIPGNRRNYAAAGIDGPVMAVLGCYDAEGTRTVRVFEDIRPYIQNETHSISADRETEVVILVDGIQDVRWVELTLQPTGSEQLAVWDLGEMTLRLGDSGQLLRRELTESIPEGETRHLSFASVYISGDVTYPLYPESMKPEGQEPQLTTAHIGDGSMSLLLGSGQGVRVVPTVNGSEEGFSVELLLLDPVTGVTGQANLSTTHGYTGKYLGDLIDEAKAVLGTGTQQEVSAAQKLIDVIRELTGSAGSFQPDDRGVTFMAPRNFSGSSLCYRINVRSVETGDVAFTVDLTVQSEPDMLSAALEELRTAQNNALLQKLNEEISSRGDGAAAGQDPEAPGAENTGAGAGETEAPAPDEPEPAPDEPAPEPEPAPDGEGEPGASAPEIPSDSP